MAGTKPVSYTHLEVYKRQHAARLEEEYAARGYLVESCIPHGAKDYNELLQKELARERGTER